MFLRAKIRRKNGTIHRYWSVVENRRTSGGRVVQRRVLYLGEINDAQKQDWYKTIDVLAEGNASPSQLAIFPQDRPAPPMECAVVQVRLDQLRLERPRQWGACWLALELWGWLKLDEFWAPRLPASRKGTDWLNVFKTMAVYRFIDTGSAWRLHRQWFADSAIGDLLGEEPAVAQPDTQYRCLDLLLEHRQALFGFLKARRERLFDTRFEVLLYNSATFLESDPPGQGERRRSRARDRRSDSVQALIALIVTPEGFPLAYEVMARNTTGHTALEACVEQIERQHGRPDRIWVMDRRVPSEELLEQLRARAPMLRYVVGMPGSRLSSLESQFLALPWERTREQVQVKLLERGGEVYILARSARRAAGERSARLRALRGLVKRLRELREQKLTREQLRSKIAAARKEAGRECGVIDIELLRRQQPRQARSFRFALNRAKLRRVRQREGRYLMRSNLSKRPPAMPWPFYIQLGEIEQAFTALDGDLGLRPAHHHKDSRIEAHVFVGFIAYCLHVALKARLKALATGLTPRAALKRMAGIRMVDVRLPTTDGRELILTRYTEPDREQRLLLTRLKLQLPKQPPPRIVSSDPAGAAAAISA